MQRQPSRSIPQAYRYLPVVRAYADYMIEHGRDGYGKPSPLFLTGIDRHTGTRISPPFPHVKRKPFMPGPERDRECRPHDRNHGHADPLDQLQVLHRLTEINYQGPLGTMGCTQRGDIPGKLDRAYKAWQKIKAEAQ